MNKLIRFTLLLMTGLWQWQCMSAGIDNGMIQPKYKSESVVLWNRPNEMNLEIQEDTVSEKAELTYIFGISTSDENKNDINKVINPDMQGEVVEMAAAKASEKAGSDGFLIVHSEKTRKGFFPIFWKDEYKVKGKPVKVKSLGVMSKGRFDARRRYQAGNNGLLGFWDGLELTHLGPAPKGPSRNQVVRSSRAGLQIGVSMGLPEPETETLRLNEPNGYAELGFIASNGLFFGGNFGFVEGFGNDSEMAAFGDLGYVFDNGMLLAVGGGLWFQPSTAIVNFRIGYVFSQGFNASLRLQAIENQGRATYYAGLALGQTLF